MLARSHNGGARLPEMVGFEARLRVLTMGRDKENIEVTIDSSFRKDVPCGSRRPLDMIRYALDEGGKRLERGRDAYGYWYRSDGKVASLDGRDGATDRALVQREVSLAKQLLGVVDPAAILGRLQGKVSVTAGKPPLGARPKASYWVATGTLADYPFYTLPHEKGKQRTALLRLYVDKTSRMLRAVQAEHRPTSNRELVLRELVLFSDYGQYPLAGTDKASVKLPTVLKIAQAAGGHYEPAVRITISSVALNPSLSAADFQRSR